MRTSQCQNMTDVCKATVYAMNPFHLLGLSPFASNKALRHRKEDLESARTMGVIDWKNEFRHLLGNVQVPTPEMIAAAFRRIEDPQQRIVDEFFWFWPLDSRDDETLEVLHGGKKKMTAVAFWEREEKSSDIRRAVIAKHNMAVCNHFYAIDGEWQFIANSMDAADSSENRMKKYDSWNAALEHCEELADEENYWNAIKERIPIIGVDEADSYKKKMCNYWNAALERWEELADDEDFWDVIKERIPVIGDNRLSTGFIRRMRDEFPVAFDRINGDLAVEYAKLSGKHAEVERHLRYMNESHKGLDDVAATLDAIFDPIEREVDLLTRETIRVRNTTPYSALSAAWSLLQNTEGIRKMADEILGENHPKRIKIFDKIVSECNFCQVVYGKDTKQWEECIDFIKKLIPLACDKELVAVLNNNLKVVTQNFEDYKREKYCWFCQEHLACSSLAIKIKMYGDVQVHTQMFSSQYHATWRSIVVTVPRCEHCEDAKRKRESEASEAWSEYQSVRDRRGGWNKFWDVETDEMKSCKRKYDRIKERNSKIDRQEESRQKQFPLYENLKELGFKVGDKPSEQECQSLYEKKQRQLIGLDDYGRSRYNY